VGEDFQMSGAGGPFSVGRPMSFRTADPQSFAFR
jgi:hypothetical protein